jgi:transposase
MASLTRKLIKGRPYYYLRQCQRVDGQPKIVKTVYLGSVEQVVSRLTSPTALPQPRAVDVASFADVAALLDLAQQLQLVALIDAHLPKRHQGLSVGQYLLLAAINRATHPTSKTRLAQWYQGTALTRLLPASAAQLSSQSFWNHLSDITEANIQAIENQLSERLVQRFQLSLRTLVYDGTNFFTYINTTNPATLPARGHNKQKRTDLRQVNLGMLVSTDFHIPLFHKVYTGNVNDATEFKTITQELQARYSQLAQNCQHITLIFDKGNNSPEAFETLDATGFHFVGSLVPTQHADLLAIPRRQFRALAGERLKDCLAYRTRKVVFGQERTVLVTYNENLLAGQLQGIEANLAKTRAKLRDLQHSLRRWQEGRVKRGRQPTLEGVGNQVQQALSAQFMKKLMEYELSQRTKRAVPQLTFRTNTQAYGQLLRSQLGKTILFTDLDDWSDEEIVLGYRAQSNIESAFRDMKNPHFLGWAPMFHWTDPMIRVHAFYCVLALLLSSLLQRTLHQKGHDLSLTRMFELLAGIRETTVIFEPQPGDNKPRTAMCLTTMNSEQQALMKALELHRYQAKDAS